MPIFTLQTSDPIDLLIDAPPSQTTGALIYAGGGGAYFTNILVSDIVDTNKQFHIGNPLIPIDNNLKYKVCDKAVISQSVVPVVADTISRGLFVYNETDNIYLWDEVFTSPLGYYTNVPTNPSSFQFSILGNVLFIKTNDVNIVPKIGDYIVIQKLPLGYVKRSDINMSPISNPSSFAGTFTDGISNFPLIPLTETYQMKITDVSFTVPTGILTDYSIILDKSINVGVGDEYAFILLNRENTGLQKELFYDTFEQIEVHRSQLLGDPYFNLSTAIPYGRKNQLNYNNGQYLGIRNLLSPIIKTSNNNLFDTPFIIYDIEDDIRDRFLPIRTISGDTVINFEYHLPQLIIQDNDPNNLNILINYGQILSNENIGLYGGLHLKTTTGFSKRYGWIFYDLRIIVIDDPELVVALSYNSNRNYTLPTPILSSPGNLVANQTASISLDITDIQASSFSPMIVIVNGNHNLLDGTAITIENVKTKIVENNLIHLSSVNGLRYIKRVYNNGVEMTDRFTVYIDAATTTSINNDEVFINYGIGQSGNIKGANLSFNYFMTYRIKNSRYSSILPYGELINFNFAKSSSEALIDNTAGNLYISLPPFNYKDAGYEIDDLEFIIGEWSADAPDKPFEESSFKNIVVMSSQDILSSNTPSSVAPNTNYVVSIANYQAKVAAMGNGFGAYSSTHLNGDPTYDIYNNFPHYNITTGTLDPTLLTGQGKWTIGNINYKTQVNQYRSTIQITVNADEWNDTMNPTYDPTNPFINEKYISEIALCNSTDGDDAPLIYAKISPAIKKTNDLDLSITLSLDW